MAREKASTAVWRRVSKKKTQHAVLALCMNVGVPPPDIVVPANACLTECGLGS